MLNGARPEKLFNGARPDLMLDDPRSEQSDSVALDRESLLLNTFVHVYNIITWSTLIVWKGIRSHILTDRIPC